MSKPRKSIRIEAPGIRFARNPSWSQSLRLGLTAAIWWAPTTFYRAMRIPFVSFVSSTGLVITTFTLWLLSRFFILFAGLVGYASLPLPEDDKPA